MASIYDLKPRFQALLRPLVRRLASAGATANQVTLLAAVLSLATGAAVWLRPWSRAILLLVPAMLFVRMALNAIDGMLAREHGQRSRLGAVLNELGDAVSDAALYLPLARLPGLDPVAVVAAVVLALIGELAGVVALQVGAARRYDGPMGKSDRAFAFGLLALLLGAGVTPGAWSTALLWLIVLLGLLTVYRRSRRALAEAA